jgi:hypothetical protein
MSHGRAGLRGEIARVSGPVRMTGRQLPATCGEPVAFSDMLSLNYAM